MVKSIKEGSISINHNFQCNSIKVKELYESLFVFYSKLILPKGYPNHK